jgi:tetratricopeptide (TPR) repeat protein
MNAVVSGQAGVGLLFDGPKLASIHRGRHEEVVERQEWEIRFLFGDASDLEFLEGVDLPTAHAHLERASAKADALQIVLILLDRTLSESTRRIAAVDLENLFDDPGVADFVERVLLAHPLPREVDPLDAISYCGATPRIAALLHQLHVLQADIEEVYLAWEQIPDEVFHERGRRNSVRWIYIREGLFKGLVINKGSEKAARGFFNKYRREVVGIPEHLTILEEWLKSLFQEPTVENYDPSDASWIKGSPAPSYYIYDAVFEKLEASLADTLAAPLPSVGPRVLWGELQSLPESERLRLVTRESRFQSVQFASHLIQMSHLLRYTNAEEMLHLAHLACLVADACTPTAAGSSAKLADINAWSWGQYGNALRVSGQLKNAEEAFVRAMLFFDVGTKDPMLKAKLSVLRSSLYLYSRRFDEAVSQAQEAANIYKNLGESGLYASALVTEALCLLYMGEAGRSCDLLNRAIPLIEAEEDPYLLLAACHNLVRCYIDLDRPDAALAVYSESKDLYREISDPLLLLRASWQEGQLLRDLGDLRTAETALLRARQGFMERGLMYEVAVVSLDLAALYVKLKSMDDLKEIVFALAPIFRALGLDREALASLLQLEEIAKKEKEALELIRALGFKLIRVAGKSSARDKT